MKNGFRQSMAWLHTWTGLLLGWLLFAIFLTGTIAYFRSEVTYWMQPELHGSVVGDDPTGLALTRLAQIAPKAASWAIALPDQRSPALTLSWTKPGARANRRGGGETMVIDATTGATLSPRDTAGGGFLYRFHFELYGLPVQLARWIVGIATMAMFVAIISGVITHKKIFKDFFTFRPGKGQRSWLDMHNMTAVLALPYHIMITFSGLLLFTATLMPFVTERGGPRRAPPPAVAVQVQPPVTAVSLTPLAPLMAQAHAVWAMPVGRISIEKRDTARPEIVLTPQRNAVLTVASGSGSNGVERMRFDAQDGHLIEEIGRPAISVTGQINNAFGSLHRARFADVGLRWLFFIAGLAGTVMVGSGMVLWVAKRRAKLAKAGHIPFGLRLVERLNIGGIAGLTLACAGYFWANRLIPAHLPGRPEAEINAFFLIWLLATIWAFLRPPQQCWSQLLALSALLLFGLPLLGAATGPVSLPLAIWRGDWLLASVELMAILCAIVCAIAAWRSRPGHAKAPSPRPSPGQRRVAPKAQVE